MSLFPDERPRCETCDEFLIGSTCGRCTLMDARRPPAAAGPPGSVTVTLTEAQHARCLEAARRRDRQNLELGTKRKYSQAKGSTAGDNIRGILGEGGLALYVADWNAWDREADDRVWGRRDVSGFYEVRATSRWRNLITHPAEEEHHPTAPFVLAWTDRESLDVVLVGWAWHVETPLLGEWKTNVRHPAWFTPYEKLHPMNELPPVGHPHPQPAE